MQTYSNYKRIRLISAMDNNENNLLKNVENLNHIIWFEGRIKIRCKKTQHLHVIIFLHQHFTKMMNSNASKVILGETSYI